jgi:hypothetical protein
METLKVIIRREYNPYTKVWGYLAAFPEQSACPGRISCLPFSFATDGSPIFESHCEADLSCYYKRKIVHAKTEEAERCRAAIERYYNSFGEEPGKLRVVEKIMH